MGLDHTVSMGGRVAFGITDARRVFCDTGPGRIRNQKVRTGSYFLAPAVLRSLIFLEYFEFLKYFK